MLEDMLGEPHDRRRVVDAQPVAVSAKSHFPGWLRRRPDVVHCHAHSRYSLPTLPRMVLSRNRSAETIHTGDTKRRVDLVQCNPAGSRNTSMPA